MTDLFSKCPGAWERHLLRRCRYPHFFTNNSAPTTERDLQHAQAKDQQELAEFHLSLQSLITRCTELDDQSSVETITAIKKELDQCHDIAFGLGADLTEQKNAIAMLNEVITTAMRHAMQDSDDGMRLRLIQNEGNRLAKLNQLEYPVVCDLLREDSPIPEDEITAALLCESDAAYKIALEVLDNDRKQEMATRLDTISAALTQDKHIEQANRQLELLRKQLPVPDEEAVSG